LLIVWFYFLFCKNKFNWSNHGCNFGVDFHDVNHNYINVWLNKMNLLRDNCRGETTSTI